MFYVKIRLLPKLLRSHTSEAIRKLFHVENFNGEAFFAQRNSAFQRINRILKGFYASHLQLMVSLRRNNGFPISRTFQITSLVITVR